MDITFSFYPGGKRKALTMQGLSKPEGLGANAVVLCMGAQL